MKIKISYMVSLVMVMLIGIAINCQAGTLQRSEAPAGVTIEGTDISGMSKAEIQTFIEEQVDAMADTVITLDYNGVKKYDYTLEEFGVSWENTDILDEIFSYGMKGNVIERYKELKDLEMQGVSYGLDLSLDGEYMMTVLELIATECDQPALNFHLTRSEEQFSVIAGEDGMGMDIEASLQALEAILTEGWDKQPTTVTLIVNVTKPLGSEAELLQVQDLMGAYSSQISDTTSAKLGNISNGARLINGITLYPGEEFSFDSFCAPYTVANGYYMGKGYAGGKLVDTVGGGICQVSSTLYNAVLRAELEVTMRYNHSMIVGYVPVSSDATLAESAGKDFRFKNNHEVPVYIEAYITSANQLFVNIYGDEYRAQNRTVEYVSEIFEVINPGPEVITTDATLPIGFVNVTSAYTGYKSQLVKVVTVDGVEKSREVVNTSNYKAVARTATFGVATEDPVQLEHMNAAFATGSIDHSINIMNQMLAMNTPAEPAP